MRFFVSRRLPGGLRAGVTFPIGGPAAPPSARPESGGLSYCYVIRGDHGLCKIGMSVDPEARLRSLQTASAHKLALHYVFATDIDAGRIERAAHGRLSAFRREGEWFAVSPEDAESAVDEAARGLGLNPAHTNSAAVARAAPRRWLGMPVPLVLFLALSFFGIWAGVFHVLMNLGH